jgi:ureidoglycolate hydrolase
LKIKREEGRKSNVWERFGEVVKEDDSSADYITCGDCEVHYKFDTVQRRTTGKRGAAVERVKSFKFLGVPHH